MLLYLAIRCDSFYVINILFVSHDLVQGTMIIRCFELKTDIDLKKRVVVSTIDGSFLGAISSIDARLISFLFENESKLVSKEDILKHVWWPRVVGHHSVVVGISKIRKLLSTPTDRNDFLINVSGVGYIFLGGNCPYKICHDNHRTTIIEEGGQERRELM